MTRAWRWLVGCWFAMATLAWAASPLQASGVRSWTPANPDASPAEARLALAGQPPQRTAIGHDPAFDLPGRQVVWFSLELPLVPIPTVLELTHPWIRSVELHLPDRAEAAPVARGGRDIPAAERMHQRFPATLPVPAALPASGATRTVLLRVQTFTPAQGEFLVHRVPQWEMLSRLELAGEALGAAVLVSAALVALLQAAWRRSLPDLLFALLTICVAALGALLTGWVEATAWPPLQAWRDPASAPLAGAAAGLALLLVERAFAHDVSAPRWSLALRIAGLGALAVAGLGALFPLGVQQVAAGVLLGVACVLGLASAWVAARTSTRPALWLLAGCLPLLAGFGMLGVALAGAVPFTEWMLLLPAAAGGLQVILQMRGLGALVPGRVDVRGQRAWLAGDGALDENREEVATRLQVQPAFEGERLGATMLLLRFEGMAANGATTGVADAGAVERFLAAMLRRCLRPGSRAGRWSGHEILVRDLRHRSDREVAGLVAALFALGDRSERFGVPRHAARLRIAWVRAQSVEIPVRGLARELARTLDEGATREQREIRLDPWID